MRAKLHKVTQGQSLSMDILIERQSNLHVATTVVCHLFLLHNTEICTFLHIMLLFFHILYIIFHYIVYMQQLISFSLVFLVCGLFE